VHGSLFFRKNDLGEKGRKCKAPVDLAALEQQKKCSE
jgi:hypothetical protein